MSLNREKFRPLLVGGLASSPLLAALDQFLAEVEDDYQEGFTASARAVALAPQHRDKAVVAYGRVVGIQELRRLLTAYMEGG